MTIIDKYFNILNKYRLEYNRCILLMQVGSFHEAYGTLEDNIELKEIGNILNMAVTKKNKNIKEINNHNPYMLGFPSSTKEKNINLLTSNNYTVIIIDQTTEPPNPKREITGIYSPGTSMDNLEKEKTSQTIVCIILEEGKDKGKKVPLIGISGIDITSGKIMFQEIHSPHDDIYYGLDQLKNYIIMLNPKEIIILNLEDNDEYLDMKMDDLLGYLEIDDKIIHNRKIDKINHLLKIDYQEQYLSKKFNNKSSFSIFEYLEMENEKYSIISLVVLLDFIDKHNSIMSEKLNLPEKIKKDQVYLGNNLLKELNIIGNRSLLEYIDNTDTAIGKRKLIYQINNPIYDINKLNESYNIIEKLNMSNKTKELKDILKEIIDFERYYRKIVIKSLHPYQLNQIMESINYMKKLRRELKKMELKLISKKDIKMLDELKEKLLEIDLNKSERFNINQINENIFIKGIDKEIDNKNDLMLDYREKIKNIDDKITLLINDNSIFKKTNHILKLEYDNNRYYWILTHRRKDLLINGLKKSKDLKLEDFEFKDFPKSKNTKMYYKYLDELSEGLRELEDKLKEMIIKRYQEYLEELSKKKEIFEMLIRKVGDIDFYVNGSYIKDKFLLTKPIIEEKENSFVSYEGIRHLIVEQINYKTEFITNDISLNINNVQGILLYGINSAGKSTLMKAIGLNLILAQIGYYVAAKKMYYNPYQSIFTRIGNKDNIYKGLSSFMNEMIELRAILKRNNKNSLIISDEICNGTETKSANIIVLSMLDIMYQKGASFISATHLHEILKHPKLKELENLKIYHLDVKYKEGKLIYDRKLKEGSGKDYYGLDVARYSLDDDIFIKKLTEIELMSEKEIKKSKYNGHLYKDECEMCHTKDKLETHHIVWQKDCIDNLIPNKQLSKNHYSNLMILCQYCHDKIENKNLNKVLY